jgi:hypothetical protein|tara:strand:+ start:202 stop:387 length:186 start_codon:yes stop_codon:yes gene_type:complete
MQAITFGNKHIKKTLKFNILTINLIWSFVFLITVNLAISFTDDGKLHPWGYEGFTGPDHWG